MKTPESQQIRYDSKRHSAWYMVYEDDPILGSKHSRRVRMLMSMYVKAVQEKADLTTDEFARGLGISKALLMAIKQGIAGFDQGPEGLQVLIERYVGTTFAEFINIPAVLEVLRTRMAQEE